MAEASKIVLAGFRLRSDVNSWCIGPVGTSTKRPESFGAEQCHCSRDGQRPIHPPISGRVGDPGRDRVGSLPLGCKLAVSVLDLPEPEAGSKRRPLYGPIPWSWWLPASRLPGKTLQVASVCWLLAGWKRSAEFELALDDWAEFGLLPTLGLPWLG